LFNKPIFSLTEISCDWPVLPKIATPWQPWSIIFSACWTVLLIFKAKFLSIEIFGLLSTTKSISVLRNSFAALIRCCVFFFNNGYC
jgi:hypothetical protein